MKLCTGKNGRAALDSALACLTHEVAQVAREAPYNVKKDTHHVGDITATLLDRYPKVLPAYIRAIDAHDAAKARAVVVDALAQLHAADEILFLDASTFPHVAKLYWLAMRGDAKPTADDVNHVRTHADSGTTMHRRRLRYEMCWRLRNAGREVPAENEILGQPTQSGDTPTHASVIADHNRGEARRRQPRSMIGA